MTKPTKVPAIPKPPATVDLQTKLYLENLAEAVEIRLGRKGDPRDRAVTLRELIDSGLAKDLKASAWDPNNFGSSNIGFAPEPNPILSAPPQPTSFTASGAYSVINLNWDYPRYANHSFTEIWSHDQDVLGDATLAGIDSGRVFTDPVGGGVSRYYWIRHMSTSNVPGPWNASSGTQATTAIDVDYQLNLLAGQITTSELATSLSTPIGDIPGIKTDVSNLEDQYSVKIDNNGHVAGFGLSNTTTTAGPTSAFIVRADKFAVIDPASTADGLGTTTPTAANVPFFIDSGTTYIKAAAIKDASITSAKIDELNGNKITAYTITSNRISTDKLDASTIKLDSNILTVDSNQQLILQTGNATRGVKFENLSQDAVGVLASAVQTSSQTLSNQSLWPHYFTQSGPYATYTTSDGYGGTSTTTLPLLLTLNLSHTKIRETGTYFVDFGADPFGSISSSSTTSASAVYLDVYRKYKTSSSYSWTASRSAGSSYYGSNPLTVKIGKTALTLSVNYDYQFKLYGHIKGFSNSTIGSATKGMFGGHIRIIRIHKAT